MKTIVKIILPVLLLFIFGCAKSIIKVNTRIDDNSVNMFGKVTERNFYHDISIGDSLELIWESSANGGFVNNSPVYSDSLLFINDLSGRIYCFDLRNGKTVGQLKYKGYIYSAPVIDKLNIIIPLTYDDESLTTLIGYNFSDGKPTFEEDFVGRVLTQLIKQEDNILLTTEDGRIYKFNLRGKEIWNSKTKTHTHSSPAVYKNKIVFGNDDGELIIADTETGETIYREKIGEAFFCSPTIEQGTLFIGNNNGNLISFDLDREKINWEFETGYRIAMNPATDEKFVYIGNLNGDFFCIDKNSGEMIWEKHYGGVLNSTPLITKNKIVLTNLFREFYLIDKSNGEITNTFPLDGRGKLTPTIRYNKLIIGFDDGELRAYEIIN